MPNIIIELHQEIARVYRLIPKLTPARRLEAENAIFFASYQVKTNCLEGMMEALQDLGTFKEEQKK
jgi:hypothetical protein